MAKAMIRKTEQAKILGRVTSLITELIKPGNIETATIMDKTKKAYPAERFVVFRQLLTKKLEKEFPFTMLYNEITPSKIIAETIDEVFDCGWQNFTIVKEFKVWVNYETKNVFLQEKDCKLQTYCIDGPLCKTL